MPHVAAFLRLKSWQHMMTLVVMVCVGLHAGWSQAQGRTPLPLDENPDLFQRVITLPKARLLKEPSDASEIVQAELPVFEVYYVYGRKATEKKAWVEVARSLKGPPEGWIAAEHTQDWSIMLVMQYAPPGQRARVLFFKDAQTLMELVLSSRGPQEAEQLLRAVDERRHAGTGLIAVEQTAAGFVSFESNPYLMPILHARREQFDDGMATTLVEVASINAEAGHTRRAEKGKPIAQARRAIVFVIDTTISMEPYIAQVRQTVRSIYEEVGRRGLLERTSFGLIGYRNNMDEEPQRSRLEYVSRVFQDLAPDTPPEKILASLNHMRAADVATHAWDEDVVAGLYEALWGMNWEPFQELRLIVLITDAGALGGDDPKAKHHAQRISLWNIRQKARQKNIAILPVHLLTPEAERARDVGPAKQQYVELGNTGDTSVRKYVSIDAGSVELFTTQLDTFTKELSTVVERANRGIPETKPPLETLQGGNFTLGSLFRNEVYSAQQRYLGDVQSAEAVVFYRAWAADKDLTQPRRSTLDVGVFLTRNQLNELAQSLDRLVDRARRAQEHPETFFDRLRALALATATDPQRYGVGFATIAESGLFPSYLKLLPYKSRVLQLTQDNWRDLGATGQTQLIHALEEKLRAYQDINEDLRKWQDLGAQDAGAKVYPISLELLP